MESVRKQGINPKELENLVTLPESIAHCWHWFLALNNTRPASMGISAISYLEMKAYFSLLQVAVEPWEIEVIRMFDRVALNITAKQQEKQEQKNKNKSSKH